IWVFLGASCRVCRGRRRISGSRCTARIGRLRSPQLTRMHPQPRNGRSLKNGEPSESIRIAFNSPTILVDADLFGTGTANLGILAALAGCVRRSTLCARLFRIRTWLHTFVGAVLAGLEYRAV